METSALLRDNVCGTLHNRCGNLAGQHGGSKERVY
jgi:hypothetical protein